MIKLTDRAIEQLLLIAFNEKINEPCIRVSVSGGGCAGFTYNMFFDETPKTEDDVLIEATGIAVHVDPLSMQYLSGCEIDYVKENLLEGFKFNNPNVSSTCGCGSSFDVT